MSRTRANGGMFGIKLVGAAHFDLPTFGRAGNPSLMNFPDSAEGKRCASIAPVGHKSLVYLMAPVKRFWGAVEYIKWNPAIGDVLEEGRQAATSQNALAIMAVLNPHFAKVWRCIRVVAMIKDPMQAPTPDFGFKEGDVMFDIEQQEYLEMFNAIPWNWTAEE
jgi:hypothetical protein